MPDVSLTNSGTIGINAVANAAAVSTAFANATVGTGIDQNASASGIAFATATASMVNSGIIGINAVANAAAVGLASATALGHGRHKPERDRISPNRERPRFAEQQRDDRH